MPEARWTSVTATARGGKKDDGRRSERLMTILVTIIRRTRYIGCGIKVRQLQANMYPCRIAVGSDRLELEAKKNECTSQTMINSDYKFNVDRCKWTLTTNIDWKTT